MQIYTLTDPRDNTVRYVGSTAGSTTDRVRWHRKRMGNYPQADWCRELKTLGFKPEIHTALVCETADRYRYEYAVIALYVRRGARLNNVNKANLKPSTNPDTLRKRIYRAKMAHR